MLLDGAEDLSTLTGPAICASQTLFSPEGNGLDFSPSFFPFSAEADPASYGEPVGEEKHVARVAVLLQPPISTLSRRTGGVGPL